MDSSLHLIDPSCPKEELIQSPLTSTVRLSGVIVGYETTPQFQCSYQPGSHYFFLFFFSFPVLIVLIWTNIFLFFRRLNDKKQSKQILLDKNFNLISSFLWRILFQQVFMTSAKSGQAGLFKRYVMTTINKETDGQCTVDMSEKNKNVETKAIGRSCFINKCNKMRQVRQNSAIWEAEWKLICNLSFFWFGSQ